MYQSVYTPQHCYTAKKHFGSTKKNRFFSSGEELEASQAQRDDMTKNLADTKSQVNEMRKELALTQRSLTAVQKDENMFRFVCHCCKYCYHLYPLTSYFLHLFRNWCLVFLFPGWLPKRQEVGTTQGQLALLQQADPVMWNPSEPEILRRSGTLPVVFVKLGWVGGLNMDIF